MLLEPGNLKFCRPLHLEDVPVRRQLRLMLEISDWTPPFFRLSRLSTTCDFCHSNSLLATDNRSTLSKRLEDAGFPFRGSRRPKSGEMLQMFDHNRPCIERHASTFPTARKPHILWRIDGRYQTFGPRTPSCPYRSLNKISTFNLCYKNSILFLVFKSLTGLRDSNARVFSLPRLEEFCSHEYIFKGKPSFAQYYRRGGSLKMSLSNGCCFIICQLFMSVA